MVAVWAGYIRGLDLIFGTHIFEFIISLFIFDEGH